MQVVEDERGRQLVVVTRSRESVRVREPDTGHEEYLPVTAVTPIAPSDLEQAAGLVDASVRSVIRAAHSDRMLGVLVVLFLREGMSVRGLQSEFDFCESDLHGVLGEFRAAGLIEADRVRGEPGYQLTETGEAALERLLPSADDPGTA